MVFKLSKIVSFLKVFANVSQISEAVIAIYVHASASFGSLLVIMVCVGCYAMT